MVLIPVLKYVLYCKQYMIIKINKQIYIEAVSTMIFWLDSYKGTTFPDFFLLPWKTTHHTTFFCSVYYVIGKAHSMTTWCDTNWPRRVGTLLTRGHQSKFTRTETYKKSNQQRGKTKNSSTFSFHSDILKTAYFLVL